MRWLAKKHRAFSRSAKSRRLWRPVPLSVRDRTSRAGFVCVRELWPRGGWIRGGVWRDCISWMVYLEGRPWVATQARPYEGSSFGRAAKRPPALEFAESATCGAARGGQCPPVHATTPARESAVYGTVPRERGFLMPGLPGPRGSAVCAAGLWLSRFRERPRLHRTRARSPGWVGVYGKGVQAKARSWRSRARMAGPCS